MPQWAHVHGASLSGRHLVLRLNISKGKWEVGISAAVFADVRFRVLETFHEIKLKEIVVINRI